MTPSQRWTLGLFLSAFLSLAPAWGQNVSHLNVELMSEQTSIQPGGSVTVGFHFRIQRGWHIYWQNPGDSGQAPSVTWNLPDGFTAGDILWPIPQKLPLANLADYGYKNEVLLMVPLTAPANLKPGHFVRLTCHVRWLVCNEICIPGDVQLNLRLPVRKHKPASSSRHGFLFQATRRNLPQEMPDDWKAFGTVGKKEFRVTFETGTPLPKSATASFFPLHPNQVENAPAQPFRASGTSFSLGLKRSDQLLKNTQTLEGLLVLQEKKKPAKGYWVTIPLSGE